MGLSDSSVGKCLPYNKFEDLSSTHRIHREEPGIIAGTGNLSPGKVETDISLGFTSQQALTT